MGRAGYVYGKCCIASNGALECKDYGSRMAASYWAKMRLRDPSEVGFGCTALGMKFDMRKSMDEIAL